MFEPFFTTKGERGTGLGLPPVMAAVEQHHADLEVDTAPERGSTFRLLFPAASRMDAVAGAGLHQPTPAASQPLRILGVDDEERLARLLAKMLTPRGMRGRPPGRASRRWCSWIGSRSSW
jgi:hypothetical protein